MIHADLTHRDSLFRFNDPNLAWFEAAVDSRITESELRQEQQIAERLSRMAREIHPRMARLESQSGQLEHRLMEHLAWMLVMWVAFASGLTILLVLLLGGSA